MHRLLQRQIKHYLGDEKSLPEQLLPLIEAISQSYSNADHDRAMLERSLDIMSQEMFDHNRQLSNELHARKTVESQLEHLTNYDELTGLANRNLLSGQLQQALNNAQGQNLRVAVLILGLDHFKVINDSLGHNVGNDLLKIVAERLKSCIRGSDSLARLTSDEFALVLAGMVENVEHGNINKRLVEILQRILDMVSDTIVIENREFHITCSIGLSQYPQDGDNPEILLRHADAAMTSAKQMGRNNFQFYTSNLSAKMNKQLAMQAELRLALERNEFELHYQPQVDLRTGRMVGMEALIRWNHPTFGMIPPGQFIGLAEETGLIVPIGAWVIRTACEQSQQWKREGYGNLRIAVNLSVRQFSQPDLVEFIAKTLEETGLDPNSLEIELTESLVMTDVERAIDILRRLKALGLHLSIDDFGTGYSSLSYLRRFPIDVLKIDQSFVRDIETADGAAIVKAIISLTHSLGIRAIAEGVETEAHCDFLRANLCDEIQGFFFSRGLPKEKIEQLLKEKQQLPGHLIRFTKRARTLLLVNDEKVVASLKHLLRRENCVILSANSGPAALETLSQYEVDVIISDQHIAEMSGVEFLRIAKEKYPHTIRIILSTHSELEPVIDAVNEGAVYQFLVKPWDDKQFRWHIDEAFKRKELMDDNRRLTMEMQSTSRELARANRHLTLGQIQEELSRNGAALNIVR